MSKKSKKISKEKEKRKSNKIFVFIIFVLVVFSLFNLILANNNESTDMPKVTEVSVAPETETTNTEERDTVVGREDINKITNASDKIDKSVIISDFNMNNVSNESSESNENIVISQSEDNNPPNITSYSPTGKIFTDFVTLNITTDEDAECRYEYKYTSIGNVVSDNISYENMKGRFDITSGKTNTHTKTFSGLVDAAYYFYIRCSDGSGNVNQEDQVISFVVDLLPTATVELKPFIFVNGVVKEGIIEVILKTSEDVEYKPSLSYTLDSSTKRQIVLSGSGKIWQGYINLGSTGREELGTFYFEGRDLAGHPGDRITSGESFIVDTKKPATPTLGAGSEEDGSIELKWHYEGNENEIQHYNLFKRKTPGVGYADLYKEDITTSSYTDTSVEEGTTYYYKVSAVDKAGNEGEMSNEAFAKSVTTIAETKKENKTLSKESKNKIDNLTETSNKLIAEINAINLKAEYIEEQKLIDDLSKKEIENGKSELDKLKTEAKNLEFRGLEDWQLDREIKKISDKIETIKKSVPKNITIKKTEITQEITKEDIENAISELGTNLTSKEIKKSKELSDKIQINVEIKLITLNYLDETEKHKTLIKKEFLTESELESVNIIEIIPKIIAENVDNIEIKTPGYAIVKKDPVIKWDFNSVKEGMEYIVNKEVDIKDIKRIRTAPLVEEIKKESIITGLSTLSEKTKGMVSPLTITITIIAILLIIFLKFYFSSKRKTKREKIQTSDASDNDCNGGQSFSPFYQPVYQTSNPGQLSKSENPSQLLKFTNPVTNPIANVINIPNENVYEKENASIYRNVAMVRMFNDTANIHKLLDQAHNCIDNGYFGPAKKAYLSILSSLNSEEITDYAEKKMLYDKAIRLYNKLILFLKTNEAWMYVKNHSNLKDTLNYIAGLYDTIAIEGKDTKLMNNVRELYGYLRNIQ